MPTPAELDEQINKYAARQGTGSPVPPDIPSPIVSGNVPAFGVNLSNKQWPQGSFKGETPTTNVVRTGNSFIQSGPESNPVAGAIDRLRDSQGTANAKGNLDAARALLPKDSPAYLAPALSTSAQPTVAPPVAVASPPQAAPVAVASPPQATPAPAAATEPPGVTDKTPRSTGSQIPGVSRVGNSFTQTDAGPSVAPTAPGDMLKGAAQVPGSTDAYGNSTAMTQQYQGQLEQAQKENADAQAAYDAKFAGKPSYDQQQQNDADRFTRFVNESDTARLARDLATGGGSARDNAGKIAALNAMQHRDAAARADVTTRAGQTIGAETARGQQAAMTKGQLLQHTAAMAQILGSPLHQQGQLLDAAIKSGQVSQAKALQDIQAQLVAAGKAGDTNKQAQLAVMLRQLAGKDLQEGKLISIGGGQEIDPATGMLRANPSKVVYAEAGQQPVIISADSKAPAKPALADFTKQMQARVPGTTPQQAQAAYLKQFGN